MKTMKCPVCKRQWPVTEEGTLIKHNPSNENSFMCMGSGKRGLEEPVHEEPPLPVAYELPLNRDVVRRLAGHLVSAFEDFANAELRQQKDLAYVDVIGGIQAFFLTIVMDMERRMDDSAGMVRRLALQMLGEAMSKGTN